MWLSGLFRSNSGNATTQSQQTKQKEIEDRSKRLDGTVHAISLHTDLVDNLKDDHQHLLKLYTDIIADANAFKFDQIPEQLKKFKIEFRAHLNAENTKFYGYLEQRLEKNSNESKEMREFRKNMNNIERSVNKFLDSWINSGINNSNLTDFQKESGGIATALLQRIESEEKTLYPIYEKEVHNYAKTA